VTELKVAARSAFSAHEIPFHTDGMRIGLLGGSFNPPHAAHRAISQFAIKRLQLDRVWWLVTPGNPLKDGQGLHELEERTEAARKMADDPRIDVSCLESVIGTRYTEDTITYLRRRCSGLRFVWIMGADNLAQFHRWQNWRRIAYQVPFAVIDRPPQSFRQARRVPRAGLGVSDRNEIDPVIDRSSEPGWQLGNTPQELNR
jgi:nicotinate-nucleotide adenylyltransferase